MNLGVSLSDLGRFDEAIEKLKDGASTLVGVAGCLPEHWYDACAAGPAGRGDRVLRRGDQTTSRVSGSAQEQGLCFDEPGRV